MGCSYDDPCDLATVDDLVVLAKVMRPVNALDVVEFFALRSSFVKAPTTHHRCTCHAGLQHADSVAGALQVFVVAFE